MLETNAQACARAIHVWVTWLRHWRHTRDPRALHAARVCRQNVREILAVRRAELVRRQAAYRARRADLALDQTMYQIRSDEMARDQRRMNAVSARFSAPETKASYEVMELVRGNSALSLLVIRLPSGQQCDGDRDRDQPRRTGAWLQPRCQSADAAAHGHRHCLGQPRSCCRGGGRPGLSKKKVFSIATQLYAGSVPPHNTVYTKGSEVAAESTGKSLRPG